MNSTFARCFPGEGDATIAFHGELSCQLAGGGVILDLGCGNNHKLAQHRRQHQVWGCDFERHPRLQDGDWFRLLPADGRIPFADETFDRVAALWVLEHVRQPLPFLLEVARVLKPGGRLIALTPDARHYVSWLIRLMHALPTGLTREVVYRLYGRAHHDTHPVAYRLNTPAQIGRAARRAGLELARVQRFANPDYFGFAPPLHHAAAFTDFVLESVWPGAGRLYLLATLEKPGRCRSLAAAA